MIGPVYVMLPSLVTWTVNTETGTPNEEQTIHNMTITENGYSIIVRIIKKNMGEKNELRRREISF